MTLEDSWKGFEIFTKKIIIHMKSILYMAMSLDWYISDRNNKTPWSDESWQNYKEAISKVWSLVIGYQTYVDMRDFDEFDMIGNPKTFVFTSKDIDDSWNFIFIKNYEEFKKKADKMSVVEAIVWWWNKLNSYFLENNLVNEVFIDVESFVFGQGLKLFDGISKNIELELLNIKKYWKKWVQLHYKV